MKKLVMAVTAVMLLTVGMVRAEKIHVPSADTIQPAPVAYGGVDISTNLFTSAQNFVGAGRVRVVGVVFSSGPGEAFVSFSDTNSALGTPPEAFRLYNSSTATNSSIGGSIRTLDYPARFKLGLSYKVSQASFNSVMILYYKEP